MINALAHGLHTHDSVFGDFAKHMIEPRLMTTRDLRDRGRKKMGEKICLSDLYTNQYVNKSLLMIHGSGSMQLVARLAYALLDSPGEGNQIMYAAKPQQY